MAKIMLANDMAFMHMMIKKALTQSGCSDFVEAQDGAGAMKKYGERKPDMIIIDITMPNTDGLQALKEMKESDAPAKIVICMTMGQENMVIDAVRSGAKDLIIEPLNVERIAQTVGLILGKQSSGGLEMVFLSLFDICASGMSAQRVRMGIATENIVHINTTRTRTGGPYRRKDVLFESFGAGFLREVMRSADMGNGFASRYAGVKVSGITEDGREMERVYSPGHLDADAEGYVNTPDVDLLKGTVDSMSVTRSYEASVTVLDAVELMVQKALDVRK